MLFYVPFRCFWLRIVMPARFSEVRAQRLYFGLTAGNLYWMSATVHRPCLYNSSRGKPR